MTTKTSPHQQHDAASAEASEFAGLLLERFPELREDRGRARDVLNAFRKTLIRSTRAPGRPRKIEVDIACSARQAGTTWKEIWAKLKTSDRMDQYRIRDAVSKRLKNSST